MHIVQNRKLKLMISLQKVFLPMMTAVCMLAMAGPQPLQAKTAQDGAFLLQPESYHHYMRTFMQQEMEATGKHATDPWPWMQANVPWFDSSDKQFEEMYYFRWYAWQKHVVSTPNGHVVTEFLPTVPWGGAYNTIPDAAGFHIYEARWLRDPAIAEDDAQFWTTSAATPRKYSFWLADSVRAITLATGDTHFAVSLLQQLETNYRGWEATNQDPNGLFWQLDKRDGMEKSISGSGYRPTLNSYMYGDAIAIAAIAMDAGDHATEVEYSKKATALRNLIEQYLWNQMDQFYEVRSPRGPDSKFSNVRELIGYIPWEFDIPPVEHAVAWKQLFDPAGFAGKYGPTTAERRSPRFRFPNPDKCQWNGPSWPYATTQTLIALANLENGPKQQYMGPADYYRLFDTYVLSQHLRLPNGDLVPWIDEDLDADTGEWITRTILIKRHNSSTGRGAYYNHSGFADPLITGLIGLRPRDDNKIVLRPLLPADAWDYFAVDGLPYHGHLLTILYDKTGKHYHHGTGMKLFVDGRQRASRRGLGPLEYVLPHANGN